MSPSQVPKPSVELVSFSCPHCGAHSTQYWFNTYVGRITKDPHIPFIPTTEQIEHLKTEIEECSDDKHRASLLDIHRYSKRLQLGEPFIHQINDKTYNPPSLANVFVSSCHTCRDTAIWIHDRLIYPPVMTGPSPNPDLSDDVKRDYEEARRILDLSPRGAAALLRLVVEKICIELGAEGRNIDQQIASLVANGLPLQAQQALDAVRVIGNEAVHPGQMDISDDRDTASKLFDLVNFIAYDRISRPRQITDVYNMIPETKRKYIEERNSKVTPTKHD